MCHFSLSLCTASEPFLPLTQLKEVHCCIYLLVLSAAPKLCKWLLQMPLFLDIGFHCIKPAHWEICWEGGDRKEGEGAFYQRGEEKPSEIQNKWFLIHREAGNTAHTQTETLLYGRQASWWLLALLLQQETPPPRFVALDSRRHPALLAFCCSLFCRSRRSCWNSTAAEMGNVSGCSIFQLTQQITCSNSKGWQWTRYYKKCISWVLAQQTA